MYKQAWLGVPRRATKGWRREVGIVESTEAVFAEWHGYARIDPQLQTPGQSGVSRSEILGVEHLEVIGAE